MYCPNCGNPSPGEAAFCGECGAPLPSTPPGPVSAGSAPVAPPEDTLISPVRTPVTPGPSAAPASVSPPAPPPPPQAFPTPPYTGHSTSGAGGPSGSRRGLWIVIAVLAVFVVAAAAVLAVVLLRGGDTNEAQVTTTTTAKSVVSSTTTSVVPTTTLQPTTTTAAVAGAPGDSPGKWAEVQVPGAPATVQSVSLSDTALIMESGSESPSKISAFVMSGSQSVDLPVKSQQAGASDIDGDLVVWWEGNYDDSTSSFTDQHVYAYRLPNGPEVEVAGPDLKPSYPQVAGGRVTWTESTPLESNPEEYYRVPVYGVRVNEDGSPAGAPDELVPSAIAYVAGDSGWTYSLADGFLAWEQAQADAGIGAGTHVLTFGNVQSSSLGENAWRPSISGNVVVYWSEGLKALNMVSRRTWDVDGNGDFPATAPTFVAYFRPLQNGDTTAYEVVVRGLDNGTEQVLGQVSNPPWLSSAPIAVSANHVAYVSDDGKAHLFEWQAGK